MTFIPLRARRIASAVSLAVLPVMALAQTAEPAEASASAAAPLECRPLTDQAMSADLKAATAQSQRRPAEELAALYGPAAALWPPAAPSAT